MTVIERAPEVRRADLRTPCCAMLLLGWTVVIAMPPLLGGRWLSLVTMLSVTTGALVMIGCGLHRHRPARPLPWYLLSGSAALFAAGSTMRDLGGPVVRCGDICLLTANVVTAVAAAAWQRPRRVRGDYDLALDSSLICLAALLASWTFLISPAVGSATAGEALLIVGHPLLDAVLLAFLAHSVATVGRAEIALRLLHLGLTAVLVGDVLGSLDRAGQVQVDLATQRTPMLVAYAAIGIAALHPTMTALGRQRRVHPHRSRQRASVIAGALIVAALVPVLGSTLETADRVVVSALFALLLIGVLLRSERAIQRSLRSERRARYQADHDMLTGLLNRSALLRTLAREHATWRRGPLGLLFIDLDGFKRVNDSYGHAVGDELIADAAARIRRVAGRDLVVARYGGDEFVILAPFSARQAAILAERLLDAFATPFALSPGEVRVTASTGIACTTDGRCGVRVGDLIRDADAAMYHAKEHALGYAFHPDTIVDETGQYAAGHRPRPVAGHTERPASAAAAAGLAAVPGEATGGTADVRSAGPHTRGEAQRRVRGRQTAERVS